MHVTAAGGGSDTAHEGSIDYTEVGEVVSNCARQAAADCDALLPPKQTTGFGFMVQGLGFGAWVQGLGFRV